AEYKALGIEFTKAAATSKHLNDSYRDISKTAGDNKALVGSYSEELKGQFDMINGSLTGLKENLSNGNWAGALSEGRKVVEGFGSYLKTATSSTKDLGNETKSTVGIFGGL